jgi:hypothetical protein
VKRRKKRTNTPAPAAVKAAARRYQVEHWGAKGAHESLPLDVPGVAAGEVPVILGEELVKIVYVTRKLGDGGEAEYHHDFEAPYPVLAHVQGRGKRERDLVIARRVGKGRSRYTVTMLGITG